MKPYISMITLGTNNLVAATAFYEKLGLPRLDFEGDIAFFNLEGTWLSLYPWELLAKDAGQPCLDGGFRGTTLAHNVHSRVEVNELLEKAQSCGANIVKSAGDTDWGGYSGYFADLDGHLWEVAHNPYVWIGPEQFQPKV